jgi:Rieske Fe-S protein
MTDRPYSTFAQTLRRRTMLQACCGFALAAPALGRGDEPGDASAPPQAGDLLAFAFGERAGQVIAPGDVLVDAQQILAYPFDPAAQRPRDGTRLNQLVVVRIAVERLTAETLARSADGILAYSGVCTHTGCDVTDWRSAERRFKCPCHESEFDPADGARVVGGPAPAQLAALPLALVAGTLQVAGPFAGYVGFMQPGLDGLSSP